MKSKLIIFVISIVTLFISVLISALCYKANVDILNAENKIGLIILIPIIIVAYIILAGLFLNNLISFLSCIFSSVLVIKIISILLFIVSVIFTAFDIYQFKKFLNLILI